MGKNVSFSDLACVDFSPKKRKEKKEKLEKCIFKVPSSQTQTDRKEEEDQPKEIKVMDGMLSGYFTPV